MSKLEICYPKLECHHFQWCYSDPLAVLNFVMVDCMDVLKLLSIVLYVDYLMRDMAGPESIRALQHLPACTIILGQSMMSATATWALEGSHY